MLLGRTSILKCSHVNHVWSSIRTRSPILLPVIDCNVERLLGLSSLSRRETPGCSFVQTRCYWNKRAPRSPPTKPLSFDYSGDLTTSIGKIDYSQPKLGFESLPELKSAHEVVKKIFSLEFSPKAEVINKVVDDLITKVQDHALDVQSLEINIAKDTVAIRNGIQHCLQFRKDKVSKARLIERIHKRKCRLKQLRQRDIDKFNWIISELQLQLLPDPTPERMTLSRREKREKAAREATEALIRQKTEDLRKRLAVEKAAFDKYRELELANIEHSLREIGIGEMVSFEQTLTALGMPELVPKPEPKLTWEERMKIKKMEQLCKKKKEIDAEILRSHGFIVPRTLLS